MVANGGAPFSAYIDSGDHQVLSVSPERFLSVSGRHVESRPIKGTRRRSDNTAEDTRLRQELLESTKDRAELLMIVDLHRNDLGRVCSTGSVEVPDLFGLRTFQAVHHLEATIHGQLGHGRTCWDLVRASFPAGSISGAPKIRALEVISELEPETRGVYCGSVGYFDARGGMDLSVAIRTAVARDGQVSYGAGGGIVADSRADAEFDELLVKARPFLQAARAQQAA
jgi:para-aminobenzoate synthetase component 1